MSNSAGRKSRLDDALANRWKIRLEIARLLMLPVRRLQFLFAGVCWPTGIKLYGAPILQKTAGSTIQIGRNCTLNSSPASNPLAPNHPVLISTRNPGARLLIGEDFGMTGGTLCAAQSLQIGDRVIIGANCVITDTDFHPIDPETRKVDTKAGKTRPTTIGDDVFIGMNCLILKGSHIGNGSVIGAGSVVSGEVPEGVVFAGNPAKFIRPVS